MGDRGESRHGNAGAIDVGMVVADVAMIEEDHRMIGFTAIDVGYQYQHKITDVSRYIDPRSRVFNT